MPQWKKTAYAMSGGITGEAQALEIKNLSKGVKIETDEEGIHVNIYIIVELGVRIPEVAWSIQKGKNWWKNDR